MFKLCSIRLIDQYIISQLIAPWLFALSICSILGEVIGISFEQVKFMISDDLPISISAYIHYLKFPTFVAQALAFSLLIATIIVYNKLATGSEVIALQSYGISLLRLLMPGLIISLFISGVKFAVDELIVPDANYKAAMVLEQQWNVDRTKLAKYNKRDIIYQEFEQHQHQQHLKLLFFAEQFTEKQMRGVTLLRYQNQRLYSIITAQSAYWNEESQLWQFVLGHEDRLNSNGSSAQFRDFHELPLKLTKNMLNYVNHHRDHREMNIIELYQQLEIVKNTNNIKQIRQLKISIQERYALPFSCLVFAWLGSTLGIISKPKAKSNTIGFAAIAIFAYYATQLLSNSLATAGVVLPFWGVWLPNLIGLSSGYFILFSTNK